MDSKSHPGPVFQRQGNIEVSNRISQGDGAQCILQKNELQCRGPAALQAKSTQSRDGIAFFSKDYQDRPVTDSEDSCYVKSPLGHEVIVRRESIEFFICLCAELTWDQLPRDFEERLISTADLRLAAEFFVCDRWLDCLISLFERSQLACKHIYLADTLYTSDFLDEVRQVAQSAYAKHAAASVLNEFIDLESES